MTENSGHQYALSRRRFVILTLYALSNALNGMFWVSFSPIYQATMGLFNVSATAVNFFSTVFLFAYAPGAFVSVYTMERFGLRWCLVVGAAMNAVCAWVRYFGSLVAGPSPAGGFAIAMCGQIVGALAQPVYSNSPARISGDWFHVKERDAATTVGALSNLVGTALGALIPGVAVAWPADIEWWLLGQAVASVAFLAATAAWVRDRPPTPPSAAVESRDAARSFRGGLDVISPVGTPSTPAPLLVLRPLDLAAPTPNADCSCDTDGADTASARRARAEAAVAALWADALALLSNSNFLRLCGAYGIGVGLFTAVITLAGQIIGPCGYGPDVAGYAGGVLLVLGLVGAGVMGALMRHTRRYALLQKACVVLAFGAVIFLLCSIAPPDAGSSTPQLLASFGLAGLFVVPLLPATYENAAEATFPAPEDTSGAVLCVVSSLTGIVYIFAMPPLLAYPASAGCTSPLTPFAAFVFANLVFAVILMLLFQVDYRRQAAEAQREAEKRQGQHGAAVLAASIRSRVELPEAVSEEDLGGLKPPGIAQAERV